MSQYEPLSMNAFMERWQPHRTFLAQSASKAGSDCMAVAPRLFRPVGHTLGNTANRKQPIVALITTIRRGDAPLHVADFIVTIIVFSIYLMFRRRLGAKFGIKFLKILEAELNSSSAVVSILSPIRVCASALGICISIILRGMAAAVNRVAGGSSISLQVSARLGSPAADIFSAYRCNSSAFTLAIPEGPRGAAFMKADNRQQPERLTSYVYKSRVSGKWAGRKNGNIRNGHTISLGGFSVIWSWILARFPRPSIILA